MSELKLHHIMFCYDWRANGEGGNGHKILQNEKKELTMKDIDEAIDFIKVSIEDKMNHSKKSIQVIITNIIHLNCCTMDEFYNNKS